MAEGTNEASIALLFTVMGGGELTGATGKRMADDLNTIIKNYNNSADKVKVKVAINLRDFAQQLRDLTGLMAGTLDISPKDSGEWEKYWNEQNRSIKKNQALQEGVTSRVNDTIDSLREMGKQYGILDRLAKRNAESNQNQDVVAAARAGQKRLEGEMRRVISAGNFSDSDRSYIEQQIREAFEKESNRWKISPGKEKGLQYDEMAHKALQSTMSSAYARGSAAEQREHFENLASSYKKGYEAIFTANGDDEWAKQANEELEVMMKINYEGSDFEKNFSEGVRKTDEAIKLTKGDVDELTKSFETSEKRARDLYTKASEGSAARQEADKRGNEARSFLDRYNGIDLEEDAEEYIEDEIKSEDLLQEEVNEVFETNENILDTKDELIQKTDEEIAREEQLNKLMAERIDNEKKYYKGRHKDLYGSPRKNAGLDTQILDLMSQNGVSAPVSLRGFVAAEKKTLKKDYGKKGLNDVYEKLDDGEKGLIDQMTESANRQVSIILSRIRRGEDVDLDKEANNIERVFKDNSRAGSADYESYLKNISGIYGLFFNDILENSERIIEGNYIYGSVNLPKKEPQDQVVVGTPIVPVDEGKAFADANEEIAESEREVNEETEREILSFSELKDVLKKSTTPVMTKLYDKDYAQINPSEEDDRYDGVKETLNFVINSISEAVEKKSTLDLDRIANDIFHGCTLLGIDENEQKKNSGPLYGVIKKEENNARYDRAEAGIKKIQDELVREMQTALNNNNTDRIDALTPQINDLFETVNFVEKMLENYTSDMYSGNIDVKNKLSVSNLKYKAMSELDERLKHTDLSNEAGNLFKDEIIAGIDIISSGLYVAMADTTEAEDEVYNKLSREDSAKEGFEDIRHAVEVRLRQEENDLRSLQNEAVNGILDDIENGDRDVNFRIRHVGLSQVLQKRLFRYNGSYQGLENLKQADSMMLANGQGSGVSHGKTLDDVLNSYVEDYIKYFKSTPREMRTREDTDAKLKTILSAYNEESKSWGGTSGREIELYRDALKARLEMVKYNGWLLTVDQQIDDALTREQDATQGAADESKKATKAKKDEADISKQIADENEKAADEKEREANATGRMAKETSPKSLIQQITEASIKTADEIDNKLKKQHGSTKIAGNSQVLWALAAIRGVDENAYKQTDSQRIEDYDRILENIKLDEKFFPGDKKEQATTKTMLQRSVLTRQNALNMDRLINNLDAEEKELNKQIAEAENKNDEDLKNRLQERLDYLKNSRASVDNFLSDFASDSNKMNLKEANNPLSNTSLAAVRGTSPNPEFYGIDEMIDDYQKLGTTIIAYNRDSARTLARVKNDTNDATKATREEVNETEKKLSQTAQLEMAEKRRAKAQERVNEFAGNGKYNNILKEIDQIGTFPEKYSPFRDPDAIGPEQYEYVLDSIIRCTEEGSKERDNLIELAAAQQEYLIKKQKQVKLDKESLKLVRTQILDINALETLQHGDPKDENGTITGIENRVSRLRERIAAESVKYDKDFVAGLERDAKYAKDRYESSRDPIEGREAAASAWSGTIKQYTDANGLNPLVELYVEATKAETDLIAAKEREKKLTRDIAMRKDEILRIDRNELALSLERQGVEKNDAQERIRIALQEEEEEELKETRIPLKEDMFGYQQAVDYFTYCEDRVKSLTEAYEKEEDTIKRLNEDITTRGDRIDVETTKEDIAEHEQRLIGLQAQIGVAKEDMKMAKQQLSSAKDVVRQQILENEMYLQIKNSIQDCINAQTLSQGASKKFVSDINNAYRWGLLNKSDKDTLINLATYGGASTGYEANRDIEDALREQWKSSRNIRNNGLETWYGELKGDINNVTNDIQGLFDKMSTKNGDFKSIITFSASDVKTLVEIEDKVASINEKTREGKISGDIASSVSNTIQAVDKQVNSAEGGIKRLADEVEHLKTQSEVLDIGGIDSYAYKFKTGVNKYKEANLQAQLPMRDAFLSDIKRFSTKGGAISLKDAEILSGNYDIYNIDTPEIKEIVQQIYDMAYKNSKMGYGAQGKATWENQGVLLLKRAEELLESPNYGLTKENGYSSDIERDLGELWKLINGELSTVEDARTAQSMITDIRKNLTENPIFAQIDGVGEVISALDDLEKRLENILKIREEVGSAADTILDTNLDLNFLPGTEDEKLKNTAYNVVKMAESIKYSSDIVPSAANVYGANVDAITEFANALSDLSEKADVYQKGGDAVDDFIDKTCKMGEAWASVKEEIGIDGRKILQTVRRFETEINGYAEKINPGRVAGNGTIIGESVGGLFSQTLHMTSGEYYQAAVNSNNKDALDALKLLETTQVNVKKNFDLLNKTGNTYYLDEIISQINVLYDSLQEGGMDKELEFAKNLFDGILKDAQEISSVDLHIREAMESNGAMRASQNKLFGVGVSKDSKISGSTGAVVPMTEADKAATHYGTTLDGIAGKVKVILDGQHGITYGMLNWLSDTKNVEHSYAGLLDLQKQILNAATMAKGGGAATKQYWGFIANALQQKYNQILGEMTPEQMTYGVEMTQATYDEYNDELSRRIKDRQEITEHIKEARAHGDLSENAEYEAAKEAEAENEGKIKELEYQVRNAIIKENPQNDKNEPIISRHATLSEQEMNELEQSWNVGVQNIKNISLDRDLQQFTIDLANFPGAVAKFKKAYTEYQESLKGTDENAQKILGIQAGNQERALQESITRMVGMSDNQTAQEILQRLPDGSKLTFDSFGQILEDAKNGVEDQVKNELDATDVAIKEQIDEILANWDKFIAAQKKYAANPTLQNDVAVQNIRSSLKDQFEKLNPDDINSQKYVGTDLRIELKTISDVLSGDKKLEGEDIKRAESLGNLTKAVDKHKQACQDMLKYSRDPNSSQYEKAVDNEKYWFNAIGKRCGVAERANAISNDEVTIIKRERGELRNRTNDQIDFNKTQKDEAQNRTENIKLMSQYRKEINDLIKTRDRLNKLESRYGKNKYTEQLEEEFSKTHDNLYVRMRGSRSSGMISETEYKSLDDAYIKGAKDSELFIAAQQGHTRTLKGVSGAVKGVTNAYKEEEDVIKRYFDSYTALMKNEKNGQTVSQKTVEIYNEAKNAYGALRAEMVEKNVLSQEEITYLEGVIKKYEDRMEVLNETKDFNENEAIAREEASWAKLQAKIASLVDQRKDLRFFNKDAARTIDYLDRIAHISFKDLQIGRFTNEILGIIDKDFGGRDKNRGIIQDIDNLIRGGLTDESIAQFDEKYGVSKNRSGQEATAAFGQEKAKEIYGAAAQSVVELRDKLQECINTKESFDIKMANPIDVSYYNGLKESLGGVIDEGGELGNMFKELDAAMSSENPALAAENVVQRYQWMITEAGRIADLRDTMFNQLSAGNLNPETFGAIRVQFADLDNNEVAQNFIRAFEDFYNKNGYVNGEDEAITNAFASTKAQWELAKGGQSRFFVKFEEEDYEQIEKELKGIDIEGEKLKPVLAKLEAQKGMPVATEGFREAQAALAELLNEGSGIKDFINSLYAGASTSFDMDSFNKLGEKVDSLEKIFPGVRETYNQMKAKIEEPITLDVFDQVVEGIDTTTEEGQKLKEQVITLRGEFENGSYNLTNLSSLANIFEATTPEAKIAAQAVELFNKALNPDLSTMIDARKYMVDVSTAGSTELANLAHEMDDFTNKTKRAFGTNLVQRASSMLTRSLMRPIRQIWTNVKGLESSLAQLEIVSKDASVWSQKFCDTISESAIKTATSVTTMVDSVTEYARLGYSISDATAFAKLTAEYSKVANTDVSTATTNITGIIKAFDISVNDLERALDELIRVGNNFAISSAELGEGLNNAAAALVANGNTLEQSLGMLAAANATVQDVSRASTAVRTVAARVSNSTSELEELGEDTSEIISTANLAAQMKTFGIAIQDVNGNLYSTYDILDQVAEKWDTYSNTAQASIAALLAGTRQQAVFYSMIQNWDDAKEAVEECGDAGGELSDSYGIYIDTIEGRLAQLSATWEQFSENILGSDLIKNAVKWLNNILGAINKMVPAIKSMGTVFAALFAIIGNAIANRITKQVQKARTGVQGLNAALQKTGTDASLGTKGIAGTEGAGSGMQLSPRQQRRQQRLDRPGFGQNIRMAFGGGKGYRFNNSAGAFSVKNEAKIGNLEYEINKRDATVKAYEIEKTDKLSRTENPKDRRAIEEYYDDLIEYEKAVRADYEKKLEAERSKQGGEANGGTKKKKAKIQEENPEKEAEQQPAGEEKNNTASENPTPIENETEQTEELKEVANSATPPVTQLAESIDEVDANARSAAEGEGELGREIEATGEDVEKAGEDVGGFGDRTANAFGKQTKKAKKNTEKLDDSIQEMNDDAQKTGEEMPEMAEGIDQVNEAAQKSNGSHFNGMYNSILILVEIVASLTQMIGSATDSEQWTSFATAALIAGGIIVVVINMIKKAADGLSKTSIIAIITLVISLVTTIVNLVNNWETKAQRNARKNREALEADLDLLQQYKDSLEELTDDYDDLCDRIDELRYKASNGTITAAEDAELTRSLEQANIDEQKIQTEQTKVDETQKKVTDEAKTATENMTTVGYSYRQFFKATTGTARAGRKSDKFLDALKKENKEAGHTIYDTDNMTEEEWLLAMASHYNILDSEEKELFKQEIEAIQNNAENLYHTQAEIDAETDEAKKALMEEDNESYKASRKILDEVALAMNNTTEAWESTFQNIIGRDMYTQAREFVEAISSLELSVENEIEEFEKMLQDTTDDELAAMLEKQGKTEQEIADDIAYISELRTALEELTSEEIDVAAGALGMDADDFAKVMNRLSDDDLDKIVQSFDDIGEDGNRIATILKGIDNDNVAKLASDFGYTIEETMAIIDDAVNNIQDYEGMSDLIEYLQGLGMIGDVSEDTLKYEARVNVAEEYDYAFESWLNRQLILDRVDKFGDYDTDSPGVAEYVAARENSYRSQYEAWVENAVEELYQQWLAEGKSGESVWELLEREIMSYQGGSITGNIYKASYSAMLSDMDGAFDALSSALDDISDMGIVSSDTIQDMLENYSDLVDEYFVLTSQGYQLKDEFADLEANPTAVLEDYAKGQLENYVDSVIDARDAVKEAQDALDNTTEGSTEYLQAVIDLYIANEDLARAEGNLQTMESAISTELRQKELDKITDELQDQVDALEDQLDAYQDLIDLRKDLLQTYQDEISYQKELADKTKSVSDLETQLAVAQLDNSAAGLARQRELQSELDSAKEELDEFTLENAIDKVTNQLEKEGDEFEKVINKQTDALETKMDEIASNFRIDVEYEYEDVLDENGKPTGEQQIVGVKSITTSYHTGGFVGGEINDNEEFAKLLKGEFVATPAMMQQFMDTTLPGIAEAAAATRNLGGNNFYSPLITLNCEGITTEAIPSMEKIVKRAVSEVEKHIDSGFSRAGRNTRSLNLSL